MLDFRRVWLRAIWPGLLVVSILLIVYSIKYSIIYYNINVILKFRPLFFIIVQNSTHLIIWISWISVQINLLYQQNFTTRTPPHFLLLTVFELSESYKKTKKYIIELRVRKLFSSFASQYHIYTEL